MTGIFRSAIVTENTFMIAFHQILHSKVSVLIVTGKQWVQKPTDAQVLCGFGRVVASTATTPGTAWEPHCSQGPGGFILPHVEASCFGSMRHGKEGNETFMTQLGQANIGRFSRLGHTGFKEGSHLKLSFWSQFFYYLKVNFYKIFLEHGV